MRFLQDLQNKINGFANNLKSDLTDIIEVEGTNFIKKNFQDEGFNDTGLEKWEQRKTTDSRGRDNTRYRTNRVGRAGSLNKYGRMIQDRPILTGHATGGDKLRNSFRARKQGNAVVFFTYKRYAQRHNEGLKRMPKRQFMGKSKYLDRKITDKFGRYVKSRIGL